MTASTPEQMRQRAADHETAAQHGALLKDAEAHRETAAMLRAAADQLEAVQELHRWLRKNIGSPALHARLDQFTADTAPQGDRDE